MEKTFTLEEVIQNAVQSLSGLSVPVVLIDSMGAELARITKNLQACLEFIHGQASAAGTQEEAEDGRETDAE